MKLKSVILIATAVVLALAFAGCAQDSTDTSDVVPTMQHRILTGQDDEPVDPGVVEGQGSKPSQSTNPTRTEAKGGTSGNVLPLAADPTGQLKYDTDQLSANAGKLTINFTNAAPIPHDVAVEKGSDVLGTSKEITKSKTSLVIKDIKPGTYTYFCTVPGHRQAGMQGTLTVR